MLMGIFGLVLLVTGLLAMALRHYYGSIPAKELKRLAARGDHLAAALYRPVAYGSSMHLFLWMVFGFSFSFGVLFVAGSLPGPVAFAVVAVTLAMTFLIQSLRLTVRSAHLVIQATPALSWILAYVHTPINAVVKVASKYHNHHKHTGLYEKEDIIALIRQQKDQEDNRVSQHSLEIIEHALEFDERQAADVLLPMSRVKMVRKDDHIGPILLKELHDSKQNNFLVYEDSPEHVVGFLSLNDAVKARQGGIVGDLVQKQHLVYVHEDFSLTQVMQAFAQTGVFMVVVINSFEEAVGVITLEQLLCELVGNISTDGEAMPYEDRATVAAYKTLQPEPEPASEQPDDTPEQLQDEPVQD